MLRRFFAGLLILSALISEGLVDFPSMVYNVYLASGNELGLAGEKAVSLSGQSTPRSSSSAIKGALVYGTFILSSHNIDKFKIKSIPGTGIYENNVYLTCIAQDSIKAPFTPDDKDCILSKSDVSPPVLA